MIKGRKRHILVDTEGNLLRVAVTPANLHDHLGLEDVCVLAKPVCPRMELIWADGAYQGREAWLKQEYGWKLEVVHKLVDQEGFVPLHRRWVVERTFAWFGRNRRLAKDYEGLTESAEYWIYIAMIRILLRRFTR